MEDALQLWASDVCLSLPPTTENKKEKFSFWENAFTEKGVVTFFFYTFVPAASLAAMLTHKTDFSARSYMEYKLIIPSTHMFSKTLYNLKEIY